MQKYTKLRVLGRGSYGAALLVSLKSDPTQKFVMKEVLIGHLKKAEQDAAMREAELLSQMSHSNIVMYVESFIGGPNLYIVMDYADGGDLTSAIQRRKAANAPFLEHEAMNFFVQICMALRHVHDRQIVHRDLKSQNVFLTSKGIVKLGDFGIARVLDGTGDCARTQIGTPYYLSPEICENQPYGKKSDIWSLGVLLYELLQMEVPFQAQSLPALVFKICTSDPAPIQGRYSDQIKNLVKLMLEKSVNKRPTIKQVIKSDYVQQHTRDILSNSIKSGTGGAEADANTDQVISPTSNPARQPEISPHQILAGGANLQMKEDAVSREERRKSDREKMRQFRAQQALKNPKKRLGENEPVELARNKAQSGVETPAQGHVDAAIAVFEKLSAAPDPQGGEANRRQGRSRSLAEYVAKGPNSDRHNYPQQAYSREQKAVGQAYEAHVEEMKKLYMQNQVEAQKNKARALLQVQAPSPMLGLEDAQVQIRMPIQRPGQEKQQQQQQREKIMQNAARENFFSNRAAAAEIKRKVEMQMRGVDNNSSRGPRSYIVEEEPDQQIIAGGRVEEVKRQQQIKREQEQAEYELKLHAAREQARQDRRRIEIMRHSPKTSTEEPPASQNVYHSPVPSPSLDGAEEVKRQHQLRKEIEQAEYERKLEMAREQARQDRRRIEILRGAQSPSIDESPSDFIDATLITQIESLANVSTVDDSRQLQTESITSEKPSVSFDIPTDGFVLQSARRKPRSRWGAPSKEPVEALRLVREESKGDDEIEDELEQHIDNEESDSNRILEKLNKRRRTRDDVASEARDILRKLRKARNQKAQAQGAGKALGDLMRQIDDVKRVALVGEMKQEGCVGLEAYPEAVIEVDRASKEDLRKPNDGSAGVGTMIASSMDMPDSIDDWLSRQISDISPRFTTPKDGTRAITEDSDRVRAPTDDAFADVEVEDLQCTLVRALVMGTDEGDDDD